MHAYMHTHTYIVHTYIRKQSTFSLSWVPTFLSSGKRKYEGSREIDRENKERVYRTEYICFVCMFHFVCGLGFNSNIQGLIYYSLFFLVYFSLVFLIQVSCSITLSKIHTYIHTYIQTDRQTDIQFFPFYLFFYTFYLMKLYLRVLLFGFVVSHNKNTYVSYNVDT